MRIVRDRSGFTLIELMISMVVGVIVLGSALSFAVMTWRTTEGNEVRIDVQKNARFIGMSLERDMQFTGVGVANNPWFGSLTAMNDTVTLLSVPFEPTEAPVYDLVPPAGVNNPLAAGGTCGATCLDLAKVGGTTEIQAGDIVRLQVGDQRRLLLVQTITDNGANFQLQFANLNTFLHHQGALSGGLLLDRYSTFVQELRPVVYWVQNGQLMRAQAVNADGTPRGSVIADGVQAWRVTLIFLDGDEAPQANGTDADGTNDYDDVIGIRVRATLAATRLSKNVSGGNLYTRNYEWVYAPRNLMWERNRL
jgi:prepilin-type N-terminal cleavage/methylation domain-containing protein